MAPLSGVDDRFSLGELLAGPPEEAAPRLLGCLLTSRSGDEEVVLRLTEVEAYKGEEDPASHAYRGRTDRNGSMFEAPGTLYVYRSYGVHWCANVACGPEGVGWGVLFRAGEILEGAPVARRRRGRATNLAIGPGNLTQALAITGAMNGSFLLGDDSEVTLDGGPPPSVVVATPRVGLATATELHWRFVAAATAAPG